METKTPTKKTHEELYRQFVDSGSGDLRGFCTANGTNYHTFVSWLRRNRRGSGQMTAANIDDLHATLAPLEITGTPSTAERVPQAPIQVKLRYGKCIELELRSTDSSDLITFVKAILPCWN